MDGYCYIPPSQQVLCFEVLISIIGKDMDKPVVWARAVPTEIQHLEKLPACLLGFAILYWHSICLRKYPIFWYDKVMTWRQSNRLLFFSQYILKMLFLPYPTCYSVALRARYWGRFCLLSTNCHLVTLQGSLKYLGTSMQMIHNFMYRSLFESKQEGISAMTRLESCVT